MLEQIGFKWASNIISFGALVAITSVVLTILYGQTRIMFAMCRDGLLPRGFAKLADAPDAGAHHRDVRRAVRRGGRVRAAGRDREAGQHRHAVRVRDHNIGVIVLRRTRPDLERGFRVPLVPWFPLIGAALAIFLMKYLERDDVDPVRRWLLLGIAIYFLYGRRHSLLQRGEVVNPEAKLECGRDRAPAHSFSSAHRAPTVQACMRLESGTGSTSPSTVTA